jgi:hypothetical protein
MNPLCFVLLYRGDGLLVGWFLAGLAVHAPFDVLPREKFNKLNYPKPMVDHSVVRKRALARYKVQSFSFPSLFLLPLLYLF